VAGYWAVGATGTAVAAALTRRHGAKHARHPAALPWPQPPLPGAGTRTRPAREVRR